ncbi:acyltransferase family protein [uncultured Sphingomonas sp.]|uniref:acyltransferase family protein n=1 Tax=uncultured Sphingomonas sp. TaxID=158754 RepID=UPI0035CBCCDB
MPKHFTWLDGARGIAALAVMLFHLEDYLHLRPLFRSSFLAVDLFFLISGFVLAHSYSNKLSTKRVGFTDFLLIRLIRLWPTYLIATLLGFCYYLTKSLLETDDAPSIIVLTYYLSLNLNFVPMPVDVAPLGGMFPFAPSSWSLSTEMLASIVFGTVLFRAPMRFLVAIAVVATVCFLGAAFRSGAFDLGWSFQSFGAGILRTLSEVVVGVVLYRAYRAADVPLRTSSTPLVVAGLGVTASLMILPSDNPGLAAAVAYLGYPLFIVLAASTSATPLASRICGELGRISYPLYLLHAPILLWVAGTWKLALHQDPGEAGMVAGVTMVVFSLGVSYFVVRFFDEPVREYLKRSLQKWSARNQAGRSVSHEQHSSIPR